MWYKFELYYFSRQFKLFLKVTFLMGPLTTGCQKATEICTPWLISGALGHQSERASCDRAHWWANVAWRNHWQPQDETIVVAGKLHSIYRNANEALGRARSRDVSRSFALGAFCSAELSLPPHLSQSAQRLRARKKKRSFALPTTTLGAYLFIVCLATCQ